MAAGRGQRGGGRWAEQRRQTAAAARRGRSGRQLERGRRGQRKRGRRRVGRVGRRRRHVKGPATIVRCCGALPWPWHGRRSRAACAPSCSRQIPPQPNPTSGQPARPPPRLLFSTMYLYLCLALPAPSHPHPHPHPHLHLHRCLALPSSRLVCTRSRRNVTQPILPQLMLRSFPCPALPSPTLGLAPPTACPRQPPLPLLPPSPPPCLALHYRCLCPCLNRTDSAPTPHSSCLSRTGLLTCLPSSHCG